MKIVWVSNKKLAFILDNPVPLDYKYLLSYFEEKSLNTKQ